MTAWGAVSGERVRRGVVGLLLVLAGFEVARSLSAPALVGERLNDALESVNVIAVGALLVVGLALWGGRWAALSPLPPRTPASSGGRSTP